LEPGPDELPIEDFEIMPGLRVSFEIVTGPISVRATGHAFGNRWWMIARIHCGLGSLIARFWARPYPRRTSSSEAEIEMRPGR